MCVASILLPSLLRSEERTNIQLSTVQCPLLQTKPEVGRPARYKHATPLG